MKARRTSSLEALEMVLVGTFRSEMITFAESA